MLRRFLLVLGLCLAAGVLAAPTFAAPPPLPHTVTSSHFAVHFTSDPASPDYLSFTRSSDLAARFEKVYATEVGYGFPAPLDDGDGLVDVYVTTLSSSVLGQAVPTPAVPASAPGTSAAYILLSPAAVENVGTIAHELFHAIQFATWVPTQVADTWLFEASAEWMGAKVDGYAASDMPMVGPSDIPLDCRDPLGDPQQWCDPDFYIEGGYSRWPFFQAVADRYGTTFVQSVLALGHGGMTAIGALGAAIAARGGTLGDVYGDWAVEQMTGYGIGNLDKLGVTPYTSVATGTTNISDSFDVTVDHLATRYAQFTRGDGAADHPCFAATLTITVKLPSGVTSRPFFYWSAKGSHPVALAIANGSAAAALPWDTCLWSADAGYLALPNAGGPDTAPFKVTWQLTVDPNTPAAASAAPAQLPVYGGQTNVSNADVAPEISLFGPLLLKVSAASPTLRLIVESSGEGKVHATLGTLDLGTPALRPGNNDLRFTLPKSALASLRRRLSAAGNVLTLTPVSSSGAATGAAVTRTVTVTVPAHKKTKKK